jgi:DnaJ-class molecular chaperone
MDLPITIAEAVDGAAIDVPTPRGVTTVRVPENTAGGKTLRLRGRGLVKAAARSGRSDSTAAEGTGDLFLRIRIVPPPPAALTDDARRVLRELSERTVGVRDAAVWGSRADAGSPDIPRTPSTDTPPQADPSKD